VSSPAPSTTSSSNSPSASSALAPSLLVERGCGVVTATKLLGEIACVSRFATDAKLARRRLGTDPRIVRTNPATP